MKVDNSLLNERGRYIVQDTEAQKSRSKSKGLFDKETGSQLTASAEKLKLQTQEILFTNTSSSDLSINSSISSSRIEKVHAPAPNPLYHVNEINPNIAHLSTIAAYDYSTINSNPINNSSNRNQNYIIKVQEPVQSTNYTTNTSNYSSKEEANPPIYMTTTQPVSKDFAQGIPQKISSSYKISNQNVQLKINPPENSTNVQPLPQYQTPSPNTNYNSNSNFSSLNGSKISNKEDFITPGDPLGKQFLENLQAKAISSPNTRNSNNASAMKVTEILQDNNDRRTRQNDRVSNILLGKNVSEVDIIMNKMFNNRDSRLSKSPEPIRHQELGMGSFNSPSKDITGNNNNSKSWTPNNKNDPRQSKNPDMLSDIIADKSQIDNQRVVRIKFKNPNSISNIGNNTSSSPMNKVGETITNLSTNQRPTNLDKYLNNDSEEMDIMNRLEAMQSGQKYISNTDSVHTNEAIKISEFKENSHNDNYGGYGNISNNERTAPLKAQDNQFKYDASHSIQKDYEIKKSSQDLIPKSYQIETNVNTDFQASQMVQVIPDVNLKKISAAVNDSKLPPRARFQSDASSQSKERSLTPEVRKSPQEQLEQTPELNKKNMKKDTPDFHDEKERFAASERIISRSQEKQKPLISTSAQMDKQQYDKEYNTNLGNVRPFSFGEKGLKGSTIQPRGITKEKEVSSAKNEENDQQNHYLESKRQATPEPERAPNNINQPQYRQPDYKGILKKAMPSQSTNERVVLPENDTKIQNNSSEEDAYRSDSIVVISEKHIKLQQQLSEKSNKSQKQPLQSYNQNSIIDDNDKSHSTISIDDSNFEFSFDQKIEKRKKKKKQKESNVNSITEENEETPGFQPITSKSNLYRIQPSLPIKVSTKDNIIEVGSRKNPNLKPNNSSAVNFEVQRNQVMNDYKKHLIKIEDTMFGNNGNGTDKSSKTNEFGALREAYEGPKKFHNNMNQQKNQNQNEEVPKKATDNKPANKKPQSQRRALDKSLFDMPNKGEEFLKNQTAYKE